MAIGDPQVFQELKEKEAAQGDLDKAMDQRVREVTQVIQDKMVCMDSQEVLVQMARMAGWV